MTIFLILFLMGWVNFAFMVIFLNKGEFVGAIICSVVSMFMLSSACSAMFSYRLLVISGVISPHSCVDLSRRAQYPEGSESRGE